MFRIDWESVADKEMVPPFIPQKSLEEITSLDKYKLSREITRMYPEHYTKLRGSNYGEYSHIAFLSDKLTL